MDATVFGELWRRLPEWRHLAVDLPGHGASRGLVPGDGLAGLTQELGQFAEEEGVRHVVGLSFGTLVALQLAITEPAGYASLVLSAPGLTSGPQEPAVGRRYLELAALYQAAGAGPHMTKLWMQSPPDVFRHVARRANLARRLAAIVDRHRWDELADAAMLGFTRPAQDRNALERVRASTLVILGEHELDAHRSCAELIASAVPGAQIEILADTGHLALLEEPAAAAALLTRHLSAAAA
jgi:2-succinyl-6-hydroxy-2,4-cyclohexadiene-1-carboxylate synthase